jgi:hypothetical protein
MAESLPDPEVQERQERFQGLLFGAMVFVVALSLRLAYLAGLFAALYGPLIFYEGTFLRAGLLAFVNIALVLAMISGQASPGLLRGAAGGVLFGLGTLGKPNILVMLVAVVIWPRPGNPLQPNDYRFLAHYHLLKQEPAGLRI